MEGIIGCLVVGWILLFFLYLWVLDYLKKRKAKKLKYEWTWIVKKTKVFKVWERYESWYEDSSWYYVYRLESKDENWNIYESDEFKNADHGWRTLEQMVRKYDGIVYDLWNKDEAIKQINDNIHRIESELSNNPWFLKKIKLNIELKEMKEYMKIADEWPITPYLFCNGHKISVWDSVDVFVNPENPKLYYFDLDFTKEN